MRCDHHTALTSARLAGAARALMFARVGCPLVPLRAVIASAGTSDGTADSSDKYSSAFPRFAHLRCALLTCATVSP